MHRIDNSIVPEPDVLSNPSRRPESCTSYRAPTSTAHESVDTLGPRDRNLRIAGRHIALLTKVEKFWAKQSQHGPKVSRSRPTNREDARVIHVGTFTMLVLSPINKRSSCLP